MKKYISAGFAFVFVMFCFVLPVSAANNITEMPDVKIVIDGQTGTYENTPINMNNRTLLPLKGILVKLGVSDDNEHIAWNGKEKSVTVLKDSTKIYLKIGSEKASVNGKEIVLDASPVIYNGRTYIPVNFIAKSLGMKVVWDASSKSVLIREQAEFDNVKAIIEKSNAAMDAIKSCKAHADINMDAGQGMSINMNMDMTIDMLLKKIYMNMKMDMSIISMDMDFYFADNTMYVKSPLTEEWEKTTMSDSKYADIFDSSSNVNILDGSDALYAGLKKVESENPDEILLEGDVFLGELLKMASMTQGTDLSDIVFNKFNVKISLNKNTYRMNNIIMDVSFSNLSDETQAEMSIKCAYTDYDAAVDIVVPEDVINSAVENPDLAEEI
ncbi:copper amine oxidase-like protein [Ruminiclostridium sufflavum DSM 19573]|uniref:Copper amine oxidase-like protein n=1 Tax=Ruminiclostridium sufflavum DSM 19573 TaxID=1121337 RepID=A0A318XJ95_9FIRM|nr:copper amine oxidase N-terminal domain-containing protein [Ruminiclostridium sufflavum]PYG87315.1 copper amine oxidase-like protein [Ruminiclostridium sufflavum DSM 19573]